MNISAFFKLVQILMAAGNNPLVQKFVDNMVKGTPTVVDDWLWRVLKAFLLGGSINDLDPSLTEVQKKYDENKIEAKTPARVVIDLNELG